MAIKQTPELERIIEQAHDRGQGVSDIHLIPGEPVCFRTRGCLERINEEPLTAAEVREIAREAVGEQDLARLGKEVGELSTSCGIPGVLDGQMTVAKSLGNVTVVIRLFPSTIPDVKRVGMPEAMLKALESPFGLVLFGGVTGSGKTTTALSALDHLNATRNIHICTIEDPVVIRLTPKQAIVQQREVGTDAPDVISGIRAAMKQDLDVLYINELKRVEEVEAAVSAALTGHLVITVVHGSTPQELVQRLVDVQPAGTRDGFRKNLASVLRGASVQCLLPKADGPGRVAAYGYVVPDDAFRKAIADGPDLTKGPTPLPEGCQSLGDGIRALRDDGAVTAETADAALAGC